MKIEPKQIRYGKVLEKLAKNFTEDELDMVITYLKKNINFNEVKYNSRYF